MWYVLHVTTGKETEVAKKLLQYGIETMVPIEGRMIRCRGKWQQVEHILLPAYVFVNVEMNDDTYYLFYETAGVIRILSVDGKPSSLPSQEVEWLHCLNRCLQEPVTVEYLDNYTYRITGGFLQEHTDCIHGLDRHHRRIRISFLFLGEKKQLELSYKVIS